MKRHVTLLVVGLAAFAATTAFGAGAALAPSVKVRPATITYGQNMLLEGKVPGARRGQAVNLLARGCGFTKPVVVAKLKVRRGGSVRFVAAPAFNTKYSLQWRKKTSRGVGVQVAPKVSVKKVAPDRYDIEVMSGGGSSFEGKSAVLQRRAGSRWQAVGAVPLKLTSPPTALNAISSGSYTGTIPQNLTLRVVFPKAQAGLCYSAAKSASIKS